MDLRGTSQQYRSFLAVVRAGSITAASTELGLPRPTVSRHLSRLEEQLAVPLLHRSTRRVWPTDAGQQLYDRVAPLLEALASAEDQISSAATEAVGSVRVSVLPQLAPALEPVTRHLATHHPRLTIEAVVNVRLVDLRSEGFDAAIWAGELRDPELVSRRLMNSRVSLVASPTYLAEHGTPGSVDALAQHALLRGHDSRGRPRHWWPLRDGGRFAVDGRLVTNDGNLLRRAALEGQGICLLSHLACREDLAEGRLVTVLDDVVGRTAVARVILAGRTHLPTRIRAFLDALEAHFGDA